MALIRCPECGREFSDLADACPGCSCPKDRIRLCAHCGAALLDVADACSNCGRPQKDEAASLPRSARPAAEQPKDSRRRPEETGKARWWRVLLLAVIGLGAAFVALKYPYKSNSRDVSSRRGVLVIDGTPIVFGMVTRRYDESGDRTVYSFKDSAPGGWSISLSWSGTSPPPEATWSAATDSGKLEVEVVRSTTGDTYVATRSTPQYVFLNSVGRIRFFEGKVANIANPSDVLVLSDGEFGY